MKVELDNVTLGYSSLSEYIFAGTSIKPGVWRHKVNVTKSFLDCVIQKFEGKTTTITDDESEWEITVKKIK
jgi:hypothetical protein